MKDDWEARKKDTIQGKAVVAARAGQLPRIEADDPFAEVVRDLNSQVAEELSRREVTEKRIQRLRRDIEAADQPELEALVDGRLKAEWRRLAELDAQIKKPDAKDSDKQPAVDAWRANYVAERMLKFENLADPVVRDSLKDEWRQLAEVDAQIRHPNAPTAAGQPAVAIARANYVAERMLRFENLADPTELTVRRRILEGGDLSAKRQRADKILEDLRLQELFRYSKSEQDRPTLNNFNDLCEEIVKTDPAQWGEKGTHPLIDKDGKIHEENFVRWIRERISWHHGNSPDTPLEFARIIDIGKENTELWRFLSLGQILESPNQFFTRINPDGTSEYMHDLYLEVTNYMWLIPKLRNMETQFRTIMFDGENAMKALDQLFASNDFTKLGLGGKTTLETIFTMAEEVKHIDERLPEDRDVSLGDLIGEGFLMYNNIINIEYLQHEFGDLKFFLTKKGFERAIYSQLAGKKRTDSKSDDAQAIKEFADSLNGHGPAVTQAENHLKLTQFLRNAELDGNNDSIHWEEFFDNTTGRLKTDARTLRNFVKILNPFDPIQKNQDQLNVVRKLVQQGAAEHARMMKRPEGAIEDTPAARAKRAAEEEWFVMDSATGFGEMMSYLMCYPFGAAAKAEMSIKGANSMVNPYYIKFRKDKMESESKAGRSGGLYTHGLVLSSFTDFVTGLKSIDGDTIVDILEKKHKVLKAQYEGNYNTSVEVSGETVDLAALPADEVERDKVLRRLRKRIAQTARFRRNDSQNIAGVGWKNQFKVAEMEFSGEEMNFDKFVVIGLHGTKYDTVGMQKEVKEKWIDPYRKAWDTNKVPFETMVDACVDNKPEEGPYKFERITHLERMLSPQVREIIQKIWIHEVNHPFNGDLEKLRARGRGVRFLDSHGNVIKNPDGTLPDYVKEILSNDEFNRIAVKATLLTRASAELFSHTTVHGDAQHMSWRNRVKAIGGLAHIPAGRHVDTHNFQHSHQTDYYFRAFDMALLEEMSDNKFF